MILRDEMMLDTGLLMSRTLPRDQGTKVEITSWCLVAICSVFLGLRIYCKFMRHRGLWWDDHILIASWLMLIAACACTSVNIQLGFGKHRDEILDENLEDTARIGSVVAFLSVLAIMWSKTSFGVTLLRITEGWTKTFVWFTIISMNLALGISALLIWVQCTPVEKMWKPDVEGSCIDPNVIVDYGIFSAVYSGVVDIALSVLPWKLVWDLQMKPKERFGVGFAMTMGIFAGATAFVKSSKIHSLAEGDFTYHGSQLVIWSIAEASTTIMAASIPVLRALFADLRSSTRKYYGSGQPTSTNRVRPNNNNTVITASRPTGQPSFAKADDRSDKSILAPGSGKILQTNEISLEYSSRSVTDGDSVGFEMEKMEKRDQPTSSL